MSQDIEEKKSTEETELKPTVVRKTRKKKVEPKAEVNPTPEIKTEEKVAEVQANNPSMPAPEPQKMSPGRQLAMQFIRQAKK